MSVSFGRGRAPARAGAAVGGARRRTYHRASPAVTTEPATRQLTQKFDAARAFLEQAASAAQGGPGAAALETCQVELAAVEMRFMLSTAPLYIKARLSEAGRAAATAEFMRVLAVGGFAAATDRLMEQGETVARAAGAQLREPDAPKATRGKKRTGPAPGASGRAASGAAGRGPRALPACTSAELQRLRDVYPHAEGPRGAELSDGAGQRVEYDSCPACNCSMLVDVGRSELCCSSCGAVRELVGTVFDESQFYSQEGQKAKSGAFNPNRHFQFWWQHILAREPEDELGEKADPENQYGEKTLEELRRLVTRDRKVLQLLTVNDVRAMLRELGRTDLNKNVPLLLKKLTGIGPPAVPDSVAARVENLFTKAITIGERVRRDGRVNRNYYPFYIFKILESILPEDDESRRVLYYIYVQSKETVEADDADWESICFDLGEIAYVPTDRTLGMKYRPR